MDIEQARFVEFLRKSVKLRWKYICQAYDEVHGTMYENGMYITLGIEAAELLKEDVHSPPWLPGYYPNDGVIEPNDPQI